MPSSTTCNPAMRRGAARAVASAVCWAVIAAGAIAFGFFYCTTPTRWYQVRAIELITWRNKLVLQYNFANATTGKATPLLSGSVSFMLIWQWCGTLAIALGAAGLMWLSAGAAAPEPTRGKKTNGKSRRWSLIAATRKAVTRARRLLSWRVPPRGLWRMLLGPGGLSLLDLLLVLLWFGLHIMWIREMVMRTLDARRAAPPPPKPRSPAPTIKSSTAPTSTNTTRANVANVTAARPPPLLAASSPALGQTVTNPVNPVAPANSTTSQSAGRRRLQTSSSPSAAGANASSPSPTPAAASNGTKMSTPPAKAAPPPPAKKLKPLPEVVQDSTAKYFGWVGRLDILLLFFPLPRCNFLHWLLDSDFPELVRYHRWLGHGTLLIYSLHGIIYMSMWTHAGTLKTMLEWTMNAGVNRPCGLIALCGGWLIWITSIPIVRRRLFNLFYGCHILGVLVFMLFAFMHRKDVVTWVMPGVLLYLLDVVLRTIQQNFNAVRISSAAGDPSCAATARVSPDGGVLSINIACHQSLRWVGGETVFLHVPAVSWWQWHPFTLTSSSAAASAFPHRQMELRIKKYSRWTQRLIARLSHSRDPLTLLVSGPYESGNRKWVKEYDTHVFVAGGIGVTPALGMIQELIAHRRASAAAATTTTISDDDSSAAADSAGSNSRVVLIWVSRTMDELKILPQEILQEASTIKGAEAPWLDLRLFLTARDGNGRGGKAALYTTQSGRSSGSDDDGSASDDAVAKEGVAAGALPAVGALTAADDVYGMNARPLSHPYIFSPLLWMAAVVLCFGGAFAGLIAAQAYDAHKARTVPVREDFSYVGMLQFAALGLGAVLPPAVLMLAVHLYRRLSRLTVQPLPYLSGTAAVAVTSSTIDTADVKPVLKSLPLPESYITDGRPDIAALMDQLARSGSVSGAAAPEVGKESNPVPEPAAAGPEPAAAGGVEGLRVAVFAAGPEPLVTAVEEGCARASGLWGRRGRAYLDFRPLTFEL